MSRTTQHHDPGFRFKRYRLENICSRKSLSAPSVGKRPEEPGGRMWQGENQRMKRETTAEQRRPMFPFMENTRWVERKTPEVEAALCR